MNNVIYMEGRLVVNPENKTRKHIEQSSWKRVAYIDFGESDVCAYYKWFLQKLYNINVLKPLRNPHVTIINDKYENDVLWHEFSEKYDGKEFTVELDLSMRSNAVHYWLNVTEESRKELMLLRHFLSLEKPNSGMHMTIGKVRPDELEYSKYISSLLYTEWK